MPIGKRAAAEVLGTFWLVFGGCGSAVLSAAFPNVGIGLHGVSIAFGLTVLTMAYAIGHISGCHLNPAVTVGLAVGKRFPMREIPTYIAAQVAGAVLAAGVSVLHREWQGGLRSERRLCVERLRRAFAGRLQPRRRVRRRVRAHLHVPDGHSRFHARTRPGGIRTDRHRTLPRAHPSHRHPGHERFREPCSEHGSGAVRRRLGARAALAVLGRAHRRRRSRGRAVSASFGFEGKDSRRRRCQSCGRGQKLTSRASCAPSRTERRPKLSALFPA